MAGLLLKEMKLRGLVERVLIVCPANLAFQWQRELADRFQETFHILRGGDLRVQYGVNLWNDKPQIITSMDLAKREEILPSVRQADDWDLVIVDEAHRMSARDSEHKSERYRLGELLREKTAHFLLLTATPHKGDPTNFSLFLQLLDQEAYADVKSIHDAMDRREAACYLRRTKEAMLNFLATFNRGVTDKNRRDNWAFLKTRWGLKAAVPDDFTGIPVLHNMTSRLFPCAKECEKDHVAHLWQVATLAADGGIEKVDEESFNRCLKLKCVGINRLTSVLFWINPEKFLPADHKTTAYGKSKGITIEPEDHQSYRQWMQEMCVCSKMMASLSVPPCQ
jgi:hypothetical protein